MATENTTELQAIHEEAMREFDRIQSALRLERLQCLQDRRFYSIAGAQWEGTLGEQFDNKPRFEINKIHLAVIRIINEYRNNKITVEFVAKDGDTDKLADTCNGLFRADEQDSCAEEAYDNAFEEAVGGGMGAFRLRTYYENEEDEDDEDDRQRIRIDPIFDADSTVFFNLGAKRQDKSDATKGYILMAMPRTDYIVEYGDDPASWPKEVSQSEFDWATPDIVYIAEYYKIVEKSETRYVYRDINGVETKYSDKDLTPEKLNELEVTGSRLLRKRKITVRKVHKYLLNGARVIEDMGIIAGKHIPIVPVYGKRWMVDNVERCMGHVRLPKDTQRLKNMQMSKLAEISAYSSVKKPIVSPQQMAGHTTMWAEDNVKNYPYLFLNPLEDANGTPVVPGPMGYTEVPDVPPALAALFQMTEQDMQDLLGNQQAGEELKSNLSGKAVELVQDKLDMQVYIYMSNMAKAIKRAGEIWLSMAKEILVEDGRKMKTISTNGDELGSIELRRPVVNEETGEYQFENDLTKVKFDVSVTVGPSSASKRSATVRALTSMMMFAVNDPETMNILTSMSMMNMEGEGIGDVRDYYRQKLVRMGVVKPTEEEKQTMEAEKENQQPDPQAKFLEASAQQAQAQSQKLQADTVLALAKVKETEANTQETLAGIHLKDKEHAVKTITSLHGIQNQGKE